MTEALALLPVYRCNKEENYCFLHFKMLKIILMLLGKNAGLNSCAMFVFNILENNT